MYIDDGQAGHLDAVEVNELDRVLGYVLKEEYGLENIGRQVHDSLVVRQNPQNKDEFIVKWMGRQ